MKKIMKYFMNGLVFLVPVALTAYVLVKAFLFVDGLLGKYISDIPGVGILVTLILVIFIGFLTTNLVTRKFFKLLEKVLNKLPIIKLIYTTIKDVISAFIGDKKSFDRPVMVNVVPESDIKALGFVTQESLENFGLAEHVAVYFPQSYNFAGNVLLVPKSKITLLDNESSQVMTFVVSAGMTGKK